MKRQECLSSLQSIDSEQHCVATETATNGAVAGVSMQPPPKSCRVGIAYWSVARAGSKLPSNDCQPFNGVTDPIDRTRLDSTLSEGEQVNVFAVDEVIHIYYMYSNTVIVNTVNNILLFFVLDHWGWKAELTYR